MNKLAIATVTALALAGPAVAQQDPQNQRMAKHADLFIKIATAVGWTDLAVSCHFRSAAWAEPIYSMARLHVAIMEQNLHLDAQHRADLENVNRDYTADITGSRTCTDVTVEILDKLDGMRHGPTQAQLNPSKPLTLLEGSLACLKVESLDAVVPLAELKLKGVNVPIAMPDDCVITGHAFHVKIIGELHGQMGVEYRHVLKIDKPAGQLWVIATDVK